MTAKTIDRTDPNRPQKMPGWFSWRHKTREAHDAAVERYQANRGRKSRVAGAKARAGNVVKNWQCGHRSANPDHPCTSRKAVAA